MIISLNKKVMLLKYLTKGLSIGVLVGAVHVLLGYWVYDDPVVRTRTVYQGLSFIPITMIFYFLLFLYRKSNSEIDGSGDNSQQ